jgi:NADH-quinone oxidoreductase subunit M
MSGFVGEFLAFLGLFQAMPVIAAVGTLGIILTAVYMLRAVLSITFGQRELAPASDLKGYEFIPVLVLMFFIIAIGVAPQILGGPVDSALQMIGR